LQVQLCWIEQGGVSVDDTRVLQSLYSARAGRWGEPYCLGQIKIADACLFLKDGEYSAVGTIQVKHWWATTVFRGVLVPEWVKYSDKNYKKIKF
ncbi:MAG: hypothetical protein ACI9GW_001010, partial [Halieaceae bacterium]